jgi:alkanesulfonate monooxygenase SsuD/methylene tetrahydromethanopterin reductase-like flavin-dependent oxidoreductase (luciferase family)
VFSYLSYFGYKQGKRVMDGFWAEMDRLGKDRNPYRAGFLQFVGVAESRQQAMDLYSEPAEYFFNKCLHVAPAFAMPPGYVSEATQRAGLEGQVARSAYRVDRKVATTMAEMVENGYVVIGTPDDVLEQLTEAVTDLNVGHLMMLLQFGNMKKEVVRNNTKLFADKVLPRFKPLFSEWEDRWWPKPLAEAARPRSASSAPRPVVA